MTVKDCLNWWWILWGEGYTWWAAASLRQWDLECLRKSAAWAKSLSLGWRQCCMGEVPAMGPALTSLKNGIWPLQMLYHSNRREISNFNIMKTNNQSKEADCSWELASGLPSCCVLAMRISRQLWVHQYLISTFQFHFLQLPFEFC